MSMLAGCRVLLVEDESLVAMLAEDMLLDFGCEVTTAMRLEQALSHARAGDFDLAVLDVNLGGTQSYPVADLLFDRCIPFLFATGYDLDGLEPAYRAVPVMQKPYQQDQVRRLLEHLLTCEQPARKGAYSLGEACTCRGTGRSDDAGECRADQAN
jgi:CheY-like chemotaxis protein